jgi:hypothetical protein
MHWVPKGCDKSAIDQQKLTEPSSAFLCAFSADAYDDRCASAKAPSKFAIDDTIMASRTFKDFWKDEISSLRR